MPAAAKKVLKQPKMQTRTSSVRRTRKLTKGDLASMTSLGLMRGCCTQGCC